MDLVNQKYKRIESIFDEVVTKVTAKKKDIGSIKTIIDGLEFKGKSVLEVGCGIGDNLLYCIQVGAGYAEGFDISGESINLAQLKAKDLSNTVFHKCSLEEYETVRKFDFILALGVFEYLDNPLESLKKMCTFLADKGTIIILISKPILIKRISFLLRAVLSKIPLKVALPSARYISKILRVFNPIFKRKLYTGESDTYILEQTVLEGLMIPRYNIFNHRLFTNYLQDEGFSVEFFNDVCCYSMTCIVARKECKNKN